MNEGIESNQKTGQTSDGEEVYAPTNGVWTRPSKMTEVHDLVLKELYKEVKYPSDLIREFHDTFKDELKPHEARNIVCHWLWTDHSFGKVRP